MAVAVVALGLTGCSGAPLQPAGPEGILATITTPPPSPTARPRPAPTTTSPTSTTASCAGGLVPRARRLSQWLLPSGKHVALVRYAGPVLEGLRKTQPGTQLKNLGCSGETTTSMLKGGRCPYPETSQVAAAVAFLKANAATTRLVTLDMGANNVLPCAKPTAVDQACATSSTTTVAKELATILAQIRAAAPKVQIVLLTYYNPILAAWREGAQEKLESPRSRSRCSPG